MGESYISTRTLRERLDGLSAKSVERRIAAGIWKRGTHFYQPAGSQRLWRWAAIQAWIEGRSAADQIESVPVIAFASPIVMTGVRRDPGISTGSANVAKLTGPAFR